MEYPMMTCIGGQWDSLSMQEVVTHEIGHMWFPMMVGSDEKRYTWMDEGLTQYLQSQSIPDFYKSVDDEEQNRKYYLQASQAGLEEPLMKHGDRYYNELAFGVAGYYKPATVLVALREVLGRSTFEKAMQEYGRRWMNKHPTPFDFFNTIEDVSGRDLDWFWKTWFYETWQLDQAITGVVTEGDSTRITIVNREKALMPVILAVGRDGGKADTLTVPVEQWFGDRKEVTVTVPATPKVVRVELDPAHDFPDVNRGNGSWPRGAATAERPRAGYGPGAGPSPRP
jgi:aminopeptidase N